MIEDTRARYHPEAWQAVGAHGQVEQKGDWHGDEVTVAYCHDCCQANVLAWFLRAPCAGTTR